MRVTGAEDKASELTLGCQVFEAAMEAAHRARMNESIDAMHAAKVVGMDMTYKFERVAGKAMQWDDELGAMESASRRLSTLESTMDEMVAKLKSELIGTIMADVEAKVADKIQATLVADTPMMTAINTQWGGATVEMRDRFAGRPQ